MLNPLVTLKLGIMKTISGNEKENKYYHPILNQKMYEHTLTTIHFVVPWQMKEAGNERKDARQLELKFGF